MEICGTTYIILRTDEDYRIFTDELKLGLEKNKEFQAVNPPNGAITIIDARGGGVGGVFT